MSTTEQEILDAAAPVENTAPADTSTPEISTEAAGADSTAAAAPEPEEVEFPDTQDAFTVKSLSEHATKNAAFQTVLAANPALKNQLYSTARQAAKLAEFRGVFANLDTARTALQLAGEYNKFQAALQGGGRTALEFIAYKRDVQGNVVNGADGPELSPAYFEMVKEYRSELYEHLKSSNNPEVAAAAQKIAEFMGDAQAKPAAPAEGAPRVADPEVARLRAENEAFKSAQREATSTESQKFVSSVGEGIKTRLDTDIKRVLDTARGNGAALSPYIENMVINAVRGELEALAGKDPAYQQHIKFVFDSSGRDGAGRDKIVAACGGWAKEHLMSLVRKHLAEVSKPALQQQTAKNDKVQQQLATPNPKGGGGVASPSRPDPAEKVNEWKAAHGGRMPSERDILMDPHFG